MYRHGCDVGNWENTTGMSVCRLYKSLFSFSFLAVLAVALGLALDISVMKRSMLRGNFMMVGKRSTRIEDDGGNEANPNPVEARRNMTNSRGGDGYAVPEEQFAYDTAYEGAAGQVQRRSLEERV